VKFFFVLPLALVACGGAPTAPAAALTAYAAEQIDCVEQADARAQADSCRAFVKSQFCSEYPAACATDGGAP
jgi:hypothetical protein